MIPNKDGPITVLAVDDNPAALYATGRVLRAAGYEVLEASTGASALNQAGAANLVVLDINLPDMDGFEVCRRLRARSDTAMLPVLHLSATFTHAADFELGLEAGADSYLTRPVEAPVLLATVRTLLFARKADLIRRGLDAQLRSIYKLAPVGIAMTDSALKFDNVNPAFAAMMGYPDDELKGLPAATVFPEHMHLFESRSASTLPTIHSEELSLSRRDGTIARVELRVTSESLSGARVIVLTDLSYRLAAERERETLLASERAARTEAERSNRLKDEFLATISHELRNPLHAILGWSSLLSRSTGLKPEVIRGIQAIERNSRIQSRMIADLLDYAGITFGKMRLQASTINPISILRAAMDIVNEAADLRKIQLRFAGSEEELMVEADPARLQQIFVNLLSNAIKFSADGGFVTIVTARAGENFSLTVRDHGKGISADFLPRIFERFSQQDAGSTKSFGGLGLGLAIVRQLVELHKGTIDVSSAGEGLGAAFTVTIPTSLNPLSPTLDNSQSLPSLDLSGVVALVVEDDPDARELVKRILTDAGAVIFEASDAQSALACVRSSGANFLISDIGMAGQDGYELVRSIRAKGIDSAALPAIAVTAFARSQDRATALAAGFQDHLVKPLEAVTLITRIAALRKAQLIARKRQ